MMKRNYERESLLKREVPWTGVGVNVSGASSVEEVLSAANMDWNVIPRRICLEGDSNPINGMIANVRSVDNKVLGLVSDRYSICQNLEAFSFVNLLLKEGLQFERAGSFYGGRRVWMIGCLDEFNICGDKTTTYVVFINSHDGSTGVRILMTPIRIICSNMLNLAIRSAKRSWPTTHIGDLGEKMQSAEETLIGADKYMKGLQSEAEKLISIPVSASDAREMVEVLLPYGKDPSENRMANVDAQRLEILSRLEAPDLQGMEYNAWRFINAVSDYATHADPGRKTRNYRENLLQKTISGHPLIDRAYQLIDK